MEGFTLRVMMDFQGIAHVFPLHFGTFPYCPACTGRSTCSALDTTRTSTGSRIRSAQSRRARYQQRKRYPVGRFGILELGLWLGQEKICLAVAMDSLDSCKWTRWVRGMEASSCDITVVSNERIHASAMDCLGTEQCTVISG